MVWSTVHLVAAVSFCIAATTDEPVAFLSCSAAGQPQVASCGKDVRGVVPFTVVFEGRSSTSVGSSLFGNLYLSPVVSASALLRHVKHRKQVTSNSVYSWPGRAACRNDILQQAEGPLPETSLWWLSACSRTQHAVQRFCSFALPSTDALL